MNTLKLGKHIFNMTKFGAIIPIVLLSILTTFIIIEQKNHELKEQKSIEVNFLEENKLIIEIKDNADGIPMEK